MGTGACKMKKDSFFSFLNKIIKKQKQKEKKNLACPRFQALKPTNIPSHYVLYRNPMKGWKGRN